MAAEVETRSPDAASPAPATGPAGASGAGAAGWQWTGPRLIGRDRELAQVLRHLAAGRPSMVGVAAGPSYGKTLFLAAVEAAARERGWAAARRNPAGAQLTITAGSTEAGLVQDIRQLLGVESGGERDRIGGADPEAPPARALVEDLGARGPSVLLIDDFRPSEAVRAWLAERFLPELRNASAPLVAVVAGLPDAIQPFAPVLDDVVVLGPLPEHTVRAHFEALAGCCDPPLTELEIDAYVQDSLDKPHVLNALTRLLTQVAAPPTGSAAP
jgi:hypothetical protein